MKILHTSDWHLGRTFHGTTTIDEQRKVLQELTGIVKDQGIDVVLIAGDIYDRALPAVDAVKLFDQTLADIRDTGAQIVVTSGNHDSATRLGFGGALMASSGVHMRTSAATITEPITFRGEDGTPVVIWGIPYLEPRIMAPVWEIDQNHTAIMAEALNRIEQAKEDMNLGEGSGHEAVHIVMAHLFVSGGSGSDSEKDIGEGLTVGGLGQVSAQLFEKVADYTALGHLHGRQKISPTVRYSGSPIAYSFSEVNHTKGAWILDIGEGKIRSIEPVDFTAGPRLAVLKGKIEDLLENPEYADAEDAWCQITLTDAERPKGAYKRLETRFPNLFNFILAPEGAGAKQRTEYATKLAAAQNDLEITTDFVQHVRNRAADEHEIELLQAAVDHARQDENQEAL